MKIEPEVIWAANYIKDRVDGPLEIETKVTIKRGSADLTFGHADAYCKGHLFDLKTGQHKRDYRPQMAVYGLGMMQRDNLSSITVHLLYSAFEEVESYVITRNEAEEIVFGIVDSSEDPDRSPLPCDYCSWCDNKESCPALFELAVVATDRSMALPKDMDLSKVDDAKTMGRFKAMADALKVWIEAVNAKSREFEDINGYHKVMRRGSRSVKDSFNAFVSLELSLGDYMSCCSTSWPKLVGKYSELKEISKEQAEEELSVLLPAQIKEGHETKYWRKNG